MKRFDLYLLFAAAIAAGTMGVSCTRVEEELHEEVPAEIPGTTEEPGTVYTLTVQADKGAPTKALTEATDGKTIQSSWAVGEEVEVYNSDNQIIGTLSAQSEGASATLSGNMTTIPAVDDQLTLVYRSADYETQQGTLEYIAAHCDYATAHVTVKAVEGTSVTTDKASFESGQAIVKFTLKKDDGNTSLPVSQFLFHDGFSTYTVTPASATHVLYVAIPAFTDQNITLSARAADGFYDATRAGTSFDNSLFYRITARLNKQLIGSFSIMGLDTGEPDYSFTGVPASDAI